MVLRVQQCQAMLLECVRRTDQWPCEDFFRSESWPRGSASRGMSPRGDARVSRWPFVCMGQTPNAWRSCAECLLSLSIGHLCVASFWEYHGKAFILWRTSPLVLSQFMFITVYRSRGKRKPEMGPQTSEALLVTKTHTDTPKGAHACSAVSVDLGLWELLLLPTARDRGAWSRCKPYFFVCYRRISDHLLSTLRSH